MGATQASRRPRVFNTPFETGVRSVVLLVAAFPRALRLSRLVVLDYLAVHSEDIGGPTSLHPKEDSRAAELLVRRRLIASGLSLMGTRNLVVQRATPDGFRYQASDEAGSFVDLLASPYALALRDRAEWLADHVVPLSDDDLTALVRKHLQIWTTEFQADDGPG